MEVFGDCVIVKPIKQNIIINDYDIGEAEVMQIGKDVKGVKVNDRVYIGNLGVSFEMNN